MDFTFVTPALPLLTTSCMRGTWPGRGLLPSTRRRRDRQRLPGSAYPAALTMSQAPGAEVTRKKIWIPMGDFRLEGEIHLPEEAPRFPAAVIAHPHPQFGGDMENNVVVGVFEGLAARGRAALRFNFRGVGRSGGTLGEGEAEDIEAATEVLAKAAGRARRDIAIVGYSFGAAIGAACVARGAETAAWIGVAPPIAWADLSALARCGRPVYVVCGDGDEYCPTGLAEKLVRQCAAQKGLAIVVGADHFFGGYEEAVAAQVELFLVEAARSETFQAPFV